jgi:hypothetical protein
MKRDNHYERAFEAYLRQRRVAYVAVDETRRSLLGDGSLKSLDFIISTPLGVRWLVDVKGRRFPSGRRRAYWKNWSTRDDLVSLRRWEQKFGDDFRGLFVFAYNVRGDRAPLPAEELFAWRDRVYGFVAIPLVEYARHARVLSPRWGTVRMPVRRFRELARPMQCVV